MSLGSSVQSLVSWVWSPEFGIQSPKSRAPGLNLKKRKPLRVFFLLSVSISVFSACGGKTPVRPPELVAPEPIDNLTLEVEKAGIKLQWGRPQRYVDGSSMDDLGGFAILRAIQDGQGKGNAFTQIATVPVEDRDRFRQAKKFSYTDEQLTGGTLYRYRVQAFTLDGYYSSPSNTVELVWKGGP